jgi:hypothetical protein
MRVSTPDGALRVGVDFPDMAAPMPPVATTVPGNATRVVRTVAPKVCLRGKYLGAKPCLFERHLCVRSR